MHGILILKILSRWFHVIAACLAIGGVFFLRILLPLGLRTLDAVQREEVYLRARRGLKMVIHPCILFLLLSGIYNSILFVTGTKSIPVLKAHTPVLHALWGTHLLLGLVVIVLLLVLLAPKKPTTPRNGSWTLTLLLLFLLVAVSSALKVTREAMLVHAIHATTQP